MGELLLGATAPLREVSAFAAQLLQRCPAIRSIWLVVARAQASSPDEPASTWNLVAFADSITLALLRNAHDLHRHDVQLRVVTDGDRFDTPWGSLRSCGSMMSLEWREAGSAEAYYTEATWAGAAQDGNVQRTRRKAVRLWANGGRDLPAAWFLQGIRTNLDDIVKPAGPIAHW
jgi:hypothetical protein